MTDTTIPDYMPILSSGSHDDPSKGACLMDGCDGTIKAPEPPVVQSAKAALVRLSKWIDAGNVHRDPEAVTWGRLAKITEEAGEVIEAYIGATGQNPRKGVTNGDDEVIDELLDVAVTALGAVEHMRGHDGMAIPLALRKIIQVERRADRITCAAEGGGSG